MYPRKTVCLCGMVPDSTLAVSSRSCVVFILLICHLPSFQVLQNLGKDQYPQQSLEQIGTRIAKVLEKVSLPTEKLETIALLLTSFLGYLLLSVSNLFC